MRYFLDFEATQFTNEIIQMGCVNEIGETFSSYVYTDTKITSFITDLTGITQDKICNAPTIETVAKDFLNRFKITSEDLFFVYGNCDELFIKSTMSKTKDKKSLFMFNAFLNGLVDYSIHVCKTFGVNSIGLKNVNQILKQEEVEQRHDALEDAKMLQFVFDNLKVEDEGKLLELSKLNFTNNSNKRQRFNDKIKSEIVNENQIYIYKNVKVFNYKATNLNSDKVYYFKRPAHIIKYLNLYDEKISPEDVSEKIIKSTLKNSLYRGYIWEKIKDTDFDYEEIFICEKEFANYKANDFKNQKTYYFKNPIQMIDYVETNIDKNNEKSRANFSKKVIKACKNKKNYINLNWYSLKEDSLENVYICEKDKVKYKAVNLKTKREYYFCQPKSARKYFKLGSNNIEQKGNATININRALKNNSEYAGYKWYVV